MRQGEIQECSQREDRQNQTRSASPSVRNSHLNIYLEQIHFNEFSAKLNQLIKPRSRDQKCKTNAGRDLCIPALGRRAPGKGPLRGRCSSPRQRRPFAARGNPGVSESGVTLAKNKASGPATTAEIRYPDLKLEEGSGRTQITPLPRSRQTQESETRPGPCPLEPRQNDTVTEARSQGHPRSAAPRLSPDPSGRPTPPAPTATGTDFSLTEPATRGPGEPGSEDSSSPVSPGSAPVP